MRSGDVTNPFAAAALQAIIRAKGKYAHVRVRPRGEHLNIEREDEDGTVVIVARATPIAGNEYGLSFRTHTGRWEPMPVSGTMEQITEGLLDLLGPYLDRANA